LWFYRDKKKRERKNGNGRRRKKRIGVRKAIYIRRPFCSPLFHLYIEEKKRIARSL